MTDPEYNRLSKNVAEMSLERHDAWKVYAEFNRRKLEGAVSKEFEEQREAAFDATQLWEERFEAAVHALWEYREAKKKGRKETTAT